MGKGGEMDLMLTALITIVGLRYWHMGETAIRFFRVMVFRVKGVNSDAIGRAPLKGA